MGPPTKFRTPLPGRSATYLWVRPPKVSRPPFPEGSGTAATTRRIRLRPNAFLPRGLLPTMARGEPPPQRRLEIFPKWFIPEHWGCRWWGIAVNAATPGETSRRAALGPTGMLLRRNSHPPSPGPALVRFRSPLPAESRLISLPRPTEMFYFGRCWPN